MGMNKMFAKLRLRWLTAAILSTAMIIAAVFTGLPVCADSESFEVELTNYYQDDSGYQFELSVVNQDKDFSGTLMLTVRSGQNEAIGYGMEISIPAGTSKTYNITVPTINVMDIDEFGVIIKDKSDKTIFSDSIVNKINRMSSNVIKVGVLADDYDALSYLDMDGNTVQIMSSAEETIELSELSTELTTDTLTDYDYIVIDSFDTSTLSDADIHAIEEWTKSGGMLIVGTGDRAEDVLSGFDAGFIYTDVLSKYTETAYVYSDGGEKQLSYTVAELDITAPNFNYPAAYMYSFSAGYGSVTVCECSFSDSSYAEYVTQYDHNYISGMYDDAYQDRVLNDTGRAPVASVTAEDADSYLKYMQKKTGINSVVLIIILIIYTVLAGPVLYLVLKKLKKREYIWAMVPALALVFVGLIFIVTAAGRVRGTQLSTFTITDTRSGIREIYVLGYDPKAEDWSVEIDGVTQAAPIVSYNYSADLTSPKAAVMSTADGVRLEWYPESTFETGSFCAKQSCETEDSLMDVNVRFDSQRYYATGDVTNSTGRDFDYVIVVCNGYYQYFSDVKDGDTLTVDSGEEFDYYRTWMGDMSDMKSEMSAFYEDGNYEKAGEIQAMIAAARTRYDQSGGLPYVIGVNMGDKILDETDCSWDCYYYD